MLEEEKICSSSIRGGRDRFLASKPVSEEIEEGKNERYLRPANTAPPSNSRPPSNGRKMLDLKISTNTPTEKLDALLPMKNLSLGMPVRMCLLL